MFLCCICLLLNKYRMRSLLHDVYRKSHYLHSICCHDNSSHGYWPKVTLHSLNDGSRSCAQSFYALFTLCLQSWAEFARSAAFAPLRACAPAPRRSRSSATTPRPPAVDSDCTRPSRTGSARHRRRPRVVVLPAASDRPADTTRRSRLLRRAFLL